MKGLKKFFSSLLAGLSVLGFSVSPAYGAAIARNIDVFDSLVSVEATEEAVVVVDSFNLAEDVGWLVEVFPNTGGNTADGGGLIETGMAGAEVVVGTGVNDNLVVGAVDLGGTTLAENDTIVSSEVSADASKTSFLGIDTFNGAFLVGSIIGGMANSGENTAVGGLLGGSGGTIDTGAAGFGVVSETSANSSFFDVFVDMSRGTTARNLDVSDSMAIANASSKVGVAVTTSNLAIAVGNIVEGAANSGANEASGGDGLDGGAGGLIETGMAGFGADTATTVNSNETVLEVDLGGSTLAENVSIDPSYTEANASSLAEIEIVNENGAFLVGNVVGGLANSGENTANGGDAFLGFGGDGGVILTGGAGGAVLAEAEANSNAVSVVGDVGGSTTARNMEVADSTVYANADSLAAVLVVNDNDAVGGNLLFLGVNSGENEANGGEGDFGGDGGLIETGEAGGLVGSSLVMNSNSTLIAGDFGGSSLAENIAVDPSYAQGNANQDPDAGVFVEVINLNEALAVTGVEAMVNSGGNVANGGEDDGDGGVIYTGEVLLLAEAETVVNTSDSAVVGDFTGDATASNLGIADSEVYANADSASGVLVVNDNGDLGGAEVSTEIMALVNTGGNEANGDGDGGLVDSGDGVMVVDVETTVNSSTTMVVGAGGGDASAENTGIDPSDAEANASSTGETLVVNTNGAEVETSVGSSVNTGENSASGGSGFAGGVVASGDAVNETVVSTVVNTNDTTVTVEQGDASATNTAISGSTVNATAESSTSTTVDNNNSASVVSEVASSSNTGGNTAVNGGSVSTGDAGAAVSGSTTTNSNTTTLVVNP